MDISIEEGGLYMFSTIIASQQALVVEDDVKS